MYKKQNETLTEQPFVLVSNEHFKPNKVYYITNILGAYDQNYHHIAQD